MNVGSHGTTNPRIIKVIQRLSHLHPHQTVITPKTVLWSQPNRTWNAIWNLYYPWGIFRLLVSQALLQSNPRSLGPKMRPVSRAFPQSKLGSLCPKLRLLPQALLRIMPKPVKRFLGLWEWTLRPPLPWIPKSIWKTKAQNRDKHPNIPWHLEKGKAKLKTTIITRQNHATENKRTIHQHVKPCMSKLARKSHMQNITCKYSHWSYFIPLFFLDPCFPSFPFACFSFLDPKLECSKETLSDQEWGRERE